MVHALLWITLIIGGSDVLCQPTWRKAYGAFADEDCRSVRAISDDEFISAGSTGSFGAGSSDIYLFAVNGDGFRIWSRTIGGTANEFASDLQIANDGTMYLVGSTDAGGAGFDGLLVHLSPVGEVIWQRNYGSLDWDFFHSIRILQNGELLIAGQSFVPDGDAGEAWLLQLNSSGDPIRSETLGGLGDQEALCAIPALDGGIVFCGSSTLPIGQPDAWIVKLDSSWEVEWSNTFGGDSLDIARSIIQTIDGGYSTIGVTRSFAAFNESHHVKFNAIGSLIWQRNWGQINHQEGFELIQSPSGEYYSVGYTTTSGGGGKDMFIQRSSVSGEFEFGRTFGGDNDDTGYSVVAISNGFVCGGFTASFGAGGNDVFLVRLNADANTELETVWTNFDPLPIEKQEMDRSALNVAPNPCQGTFWFPTAPDILSVKLFDGAGRIVEELDGRMGSKDFVTNLPNGEYSLVAYDKYHIPFKSTLMIMRP